MNMLNQKQKIIVVIAIIIAIGIIAYYYINSTKDVYSYQGEALKSEETQEENEEEKIIVHITGAVQKEGIVEVKENARINDVINNAGGLTEDADIESINLAYVVEDGQKIYIPSKLDNHQDLDDGDVIITQNAGKNVVQEENEKNGLININTASIEELQELPGIGNSTAQKIITYRTEKR